MQAERHHFSRSLTEAAAFYREKEAQVIKATRAANSIWSDPMAGGQTEYRLSPECKRLPVPNRSDTGLWDRDGIRPMKDDVRPLRIGYYFVHLKPTGGMRVIVEQVNRLVEAGHDVTVFYRAHESSPLLPDWIHCNPSRTVRIPLEARLHEVLGETPRLDVMVGTFWTQLWELMQCTTTEVVYYEQGHENLFDDPNCRGLQPAFELMIRLPVPVMAVSRAANEALRKRGRSGVLVHPGVSDCFTVREPSATVTSVRTAGERGERPVRILLIGSPSLPFKGFDTVLKALAHVKERGHSFEVIWISPTPQPPDLLLPFRCSWVINPPQDVLAAVMRCTDVFISGSYYEAFSLPPLEAMASGIPVIATDSGGIQEYARPGENCLLVPPKSPGSMAMAIERVLTDGQVRKRLAEEGKKTAECHRWPQQIRVLERTLWRLASSRGSS